MINRQNYFEKIKGYEVNSFPEALRKGHEFLLKVASENNWTNYEASDAIRKTVDTYIAKLNEHIGESTQKQATVKPVIAPKEKAVVVPKSVIQKTTNTSKPEKTGNDLQLVARIPEELRFIRRFVNLNGKSKTKEEVLRFINALQRAILEKRIRKTSPYANQVVLVQDKLIELYNGMRATARVNFKPETVNKLKETLGSEKIMKEVTLLKKYLNLNGKPGMKEQAKKLAEQMQKAVKKKEIAETGLYSEVLKKAYINLSEYSKDKKIKTLQIEKTELNGLNGLLNGLDGVVENEPEGQPEVMNSMDFANLTFETLGLHGKWFELIGDPCRNFTAMVFGKPKMGKSYLCIDFAGFLARYHGNVLYVAKEEGLDMTLQAKLNEKNVKHPNLFVASTLPAELSPYNFIFLDSVNKLNLSANDLNDIRTKWPDKAFVYVFQSTKYGGYKGSQEFQHDVDVVIEVPEKGKAVQMGRFNQGGEMEIFRQAA
jgi:hypothetical protein